MFAMHSELKKRYWGRHFLAKGYCVSTIGLDEEQTRKYGRWQLEKKIRPSINSNYGRKSSLTLLGSPFKTPFRGVAVDFWYRLCSSEITFKSPLWDCTDVNDSHFSVSFYFPGGPKLRDKPAADQKLEKVIIYISERSPLSQKQVNVYFDHYHRE